MKRNHDILSRVIAVLLVFNFKKMTSIGHARSMLPVYIVSPANKRKENLVVFT